jgi:hypothetical protein
MCDFQATGASPASSAQTRWQSPDKTSGEAYKAHNSRSGASRPTRASTTATAAERWVCSTAGLRLLAEKSLVIPIDYGAYSACSARAPPASDARKARSGGVRIEVSPCRQSGV